MVSIKDVAKEANVSIATVSNVVNKTKYVSDELVLRVEEAIKKLDYNTNVFAKGLKTKKSNIIGLIVHNMNNPLDYELINGALEAANKNSFGLLVFSSEGKIEKEKEALKSLALKYVDGIILDPIGSKNPEVHKLINQGIPIIFAEGYLKGINIKSILADIKGGTYDAIKHMISNGHTSIGFVANDSNTNSSKEAFAGYQKALTEAGIQLMPNLVKTESSSLNGGYKSICTLMLLDPRPTAIFVSDHVMTLGAMNAFNQLHINYPADVAFAGVSDLQWSAVVKPTLTVVSPPTKQIGQIAVETLIEIISGVNTHNNTREYIPVQFVVRESSMNIKNKIVPQLAI